MILTHGFTQVNQIMDAFRLKQKTLVKKISPATCQNIIYFQTNTPLPTLRSGGLIPLWSISKTWMEQHNDTYLASQYLINMNSTVKPNSIKSFLHKYPPLPRTYVGKRPTPAKTANVPGASAEHQSESLPLEVLGSPSELPQPEVLQSSLTAQLEVSSIAHHPSELHVLTKMKDCELTGPRN
jgi:hypothetical protein